MLGLYLGRDSYINNNIIDGWSSLLTFVGNLAIGSLVLLISRILNLVNISKEKLEYEPLGADHIDYFYFTKQR